MRWFNKTGQTEVWDQKIEWPIGDIEAAHIIREICRSSADSAEQVGKFARPDDVRFADGLPKTRSGKIMRRLLKDIANGRATSGDVSTLEDLNVLAKLRGNDD